MGDRYLIGLDFGTASARGVLVDVDSGRSIEHIVLSYRHGILTECLPNGVCLPPGFALHHPSDYLELAFEFLSRLGRDRRIVGIGVASTGSSPLPVRADGSSLIQQFANDPHAYIKLWKHACAQPYADQINAGEETNLPHSRGRVSGEGLIAKAAEIRSSSRAIWNNADRYIEVGDWLVWQFTGAECRSMDFACFKAMYSNEYGYPRGIVEGLENKLSSPHTVGGSAGCLSDEWISKTGIKGTPAVSVACIDSHAVLPAVGVTSPGTLVGVLGTSSGFLMLGSEMRALPKGYEASAFGAALPGSWCCEAGQAGFGDMLGWFVRTFPCPSEAGGEFEWYNTRAGLLPPGKSGLLALDWFGGNRVPYGDNLLSGLLIGLRIGTSAVDIYKALIESLAFGVRSIVERGERGAIVNDRIVLTSALARDNPLLVRTICDVLGREIDVPKVDYATAMGASIHAAVASGSVSSFEEGADRFGCHEHERYKPEPRHAAAYDALYARYIALSSNEQIQTTMRKLSLVTNGERISKPQTIEGPDSGA